MEEDAAPQLDDAGQREALARLERLMHGDATVEDRAWVDKLPRRPGPTPDTDLVQSPWDDSWIVVPKQVVKTREQMAAEVDAGMSMSEDDRAKVARAEQERVMAGFSQDSTKLN